MPRIRKPENKGLPKRWRYTRNAYYYQVPPGLEKYWDGKQTFKLGKTLPEAYKTWSQRIEFTEDAKTVKQLLERYLIEIVPTKAVQTQEYNNLYIKMLLPVFGEMLLTEVEPQHIYQYVDKRSKKFIDKDGRERGGLSIAKREVAMFSDAFTKAVQWGYIKSHPFKGELVLKGEKPRDRYVEDWEIVECLSLPSETPKGGTAMVQAYIKLKLLTGMRQQDLLNVRISDMDEIGIHVKPLKTESTSRKEIIIEWSEELSAVVKECKKTRPVDISPYLFCNKRGKSYFNSEKHTASGWKSLWKRFIKKVKENTELKEHFTEHDLRAKCASDAKTLDHAKSLLAHTDSKTTDRIYRRKAELVKPLR